MATGWLSRSRGPCFLRNSSALAGSGVGQIARFMGQIARFKGGRTRLAYEPEHAADPSISVESGPAFSVHLGPRRWIEGRLDGAVVPVVHMGWLWTGAGNLHHPRHPPSTTT
jgi:hypothetical protein